MYSIQDIAVYLNKSKELVTFGKYNKEAGFFISSKDSTHFAYLENGIDSYVTGEVEINGTKLKFSRSWKDYFISLGKNTSDLESQAAFDKNKFKKSNIKVSVT